MPSTDHLLAFAVVSLVFVAIPGPSVLFTVSRALTLGRQPALLTVVGNAGGVYLHVIAVALGIGAIVERSLAVFTILKLAGAAYLVYLGVQAVRHRRRAVADMLNHPAAPTRNRRVLADGFIVGVSNPKSVVFFAAVLPQFVDPTAGRVPLQLLVLGIVSIAAALVSDSVWAVVAGAARDWFGRSARRLAAIGGAGGVVMIGLGVRLALTGRQD
ncbi:MAG TPA: LysE family translocator [Jiangellaceae bacterium]|nr:LysE family translocator [Jiangellaceae bacterium]